FIEAVTDLTYEACENFNLRTPDSPKVYYQSVGSYMPKASDGKFPLNFSYHLVKLFDGRNDGLVGENAFPWGQNYIFLEPKSGRGISHGDMIDLNRENIDGFDVREFYVQLVSDLKNKGF
ncbi:MAG: triacylglycerol lipase, partial [Butyrivibrio sp.]|nr:triacylglycerol lipase [Butyrivibrio sp.]